MPGSIKVVLTSPRVAPGLLTRAGWQVFTDADQIGASAGPERPDVQALIGSGLVLQQIVGSVDEQWAWLTSAASEGSDVAWLVGEDGEPALLRVIADELSRDPRPEYEVEIVHGSYDVPGARLIDLVRVMDRLRRVCPWDQEQTHESLAKYLLEETYETLEAIDSGDYVHLREELGDLLFQAIFHSRIAEEIDPDDDGFSIDDVAGDLVEKLIRRHPHVFADVTVADAAAVEANWESIKATEKQRTSVLEGIPLALPALALADKVLGRAAKVLPADLPAVEATDDATRIGTALLDLVRQARALGVDPEQALRTTTHHLATQIRTTESS
ncbi:MazG family protein [Kribbella sp. NPDC023855]|uniref:MazG family protein n=1 Tax=Kribbella sp. NPDC023855 TaxID=3154698 RepID=UPI0033FBBFA4